MHYFRSCRGEPGKNDFEIGPIGRIGPIDNLRLFNLYELSGSTLLPWRGRNRGTHTRASCATHARAPAGVSNSLFRSQGATTNYPSSHPSQCAPSNHSLFGNSLDRHRVYETVLQWKKFS